MERKERCYSAPDKYVVIPRENWFVFYDPVHFSYTRVNDHGKAILESVGKETSASEVTRKVATKYGIDEAGIEGQICTFLENMTSTRFLHEGTYKPEVEEPALESVKPRMLYLHPTFSCNLKCVYCYNKEDRKEAGHCELTTAEWFDVLDQAKAMGVEIIVFTGGEPLLRKDIFELARYAGSIGMSSQILTNGLLISENNIKEIASSFKSIGLSLDSHIREQNDSLRGKGSYDGTIEAIRLLQENKLPFTIKAVVTKHNVHDIPELQKFFLERYDCGNVSATLYVPSTPGDTDFLPKLEEYREATAKANEIVESFYREDKLSVEKYYGILSRQYHCGAALGEFSIAPDGSVYPCQALLKNEFRAGSIKEKRLSEIFYDSPIMKKVRHCTVDEIDTCRDCDVKGVCAGGCRSLAYNLSGRIDSHNSFACDYLRDVAHNVLWRASCIPIDKLRKMQEDKAVAEGSQPPS